MNRIKNAITGTWLVAVYIFVSVDALLQTIYHGAWMTLAFPIIGWFAITRIWDGYTMYKGLFSGDMVVIAVSREKYDEVMNEVEKRENEGHWEKPWPKFGLIDKPDTSKPKRVDKPGPGKNEDNTSL